MNVLYCRTFSYSVNTVYTDSYSHGRHRTLTLVDKILTIVDRFLAVQQIIGDVEWTNSVD